ncbi:MAG: Lrp/AsnC family leucine-responsive transcriptional regulator [Rhodothermales bacterium]|jgi:Lrp/AsnC family leucine-responsive transcriptional regulator
MLDLLDGTDRRILNILQVDGGISNVELSRRIGLAPATTLERVRKLKAQGYILATVALVDATKVEQSTVAYVSVSLTMHGAEKVAAFQSHVESMPQVMECYHISGESDFLLKIVASDIGAYESFLLHEFSSIPFIAKVHTSFVLSTVKHHTRLPIQEP